MCGDLAAPSWLSKKNAIAAAEDPHVSALQLVSRRGEWWRKAHLRPCCRAGASSRSTRKRGSVHVVLFFARGLGRTVLLIALNGVCFEGMVTQRWRDLDM